MPWDSVREQFEFPIFPFFAEGQFLEGDETARSLNSVEQAIVLGSLEPLHQESSTARLWMDRLVSEGRTIEIRGTSGANQTLAFGPLGVTNNILINLNTFQSYLSQDASIEPHSLRFILFHEMLHTFGLYDPVFTPETFSDPHFDYFGEVVPIVNAVRQEAGVSSRGAYQSVPF